VIFCRNILIYFDKANPGQGAERLCRHLAPGGYLFLGHSESIVGIDLPSSRSPTLFSRSDNPCPSKRSVS
jgi:chemotaxis methyl-accepting protein methylase